MSRRNTHRTMISLIAATTAAVMLAGCSTADNNAGDNTAAATAETTAVTNTASYSELVPVAGELMPDTPQLPTPADQGETMNGSTSRATITAGGTYILRGDYPQGISITTTEAVVLVLDGATIGSDSLSEAAISSTGTLAISARSDSTITTGADNHAIDGTTVGLTGTGTLTITGGKDGVHAADSVLIDGPTIIITAGDDGVQAGASVLVSSGSLSITADGDGLVADPDSKGVVAISGGAVTIDSGDDAVSAFDVVITGGDNTFTAGGGSATATGDAEYQASMEEAGGFPPMGMTPPQGTMPDGMMPEGMKQDGARPEGMPPRDDTSNGANNRNGEATTADATTADATTADANNSAATSADTPTPKGINAERYIVIGAQDNNSGSMSIDASNDALNADNGIRIDGMNLTLAAGDDGIHGEKYALLTGGDLTITTSHEGIEANQIIATGGRSAVSTDDDGWNAQQADADPLEVVMTIAGGTHTVNAQGDGVDANGSIKVTGGTLIVNGPTGFDNGTLDYDDTMSVDGGTIIAVGSNGMVQNPSDGEQSWISVAVDGAAGSHVSITDEQGRILAEMDAQKAFGAVQASTPGMSEGSTYTVTVTPHGEENSAESATVQATAGVSATGGFRGPARR